MRWQRISWSALLVSVAASLSASQEVRVDTPTIVPLYHRGIRAHADSDSTADPGLAARRLAAPLGTAARTLEAYGVRFILVDGDTVILRWRNGKTRQFALPPRARAAYIFAGPPDVFAVELGVLTDAGVVCAAKRHFDLRGTIRIGDTEC
jgi:hypothetical protein